MITEKEIEKLQKLSKLKLEGKNLDSFTSKLSSVMKMIDSLQEIECKDVKPLNSVCDMAQRMNKDEVRTFDISGDLFKNSPQQLSQFAKDVKCFVVPKVIE